LNFSIAFGISAFSLFSFSALSGFSM